MKQLHIMISDDLHKFLKIEAAQRNISMSLLLNRVLVKQIEKLKKEKEDREYEKKCT